ncbi:hypothetical protein AVEN_101700-1 [Araneus ventricosus]|uniref:Uncharacterized protein n=1 Tax=Araneus ventricosus TaxID=182803 RepID=A0A4Y2MFS7_ARAVE|nr:hypothetical protein AVEN_101700-1 [Araneus ventricosus]
MRPFPRYLLGKGIRLNIRETQCDVSACRREYISPAFGSEGVLTHWNDLRISPAVQSRKLITARKSERIHSARKKEKEFESSGPAENGSHRTEREEEEAGQSGQTDPQGRRVFDLEDGRKSLA